MSETEYVNKTKKIAYFKVITADRFDEEYCARILSRNVYDL